jgi:hypothetical protein
MLRRNRPAVAILSPLEHVSHLGHDCPDIGETITMKTMLRLPVSLLIALGAIAVAGAQEAAWVGSWGAAPLPPNAARGPFPATPSFSNQTIRQTVRISAGGTALRLRISNEYGAGGGGVGGG